jgi:eukaryotic-like serine/threonine-protein kinase
VSGLNTNVTDWSRDWIVFGQQSERTGTDLWLLPAAGGKPIAFLQTPARESQGRISPDGHWMLYAQDVAGRDEIFVQGISAEGTATGIQYRVSPAGGENPFWRRDGKELIFESSDAIVAVPVTQPIEPADSRPQLDRCAEALIRRS